ncbi:S9 family peptidase [Rhizorhabdus wittichii]|uniref:S9 family peptidase n=1 Tax=Rhizorhabdus wittichii TaxID=160791 RepID=A0A975CZZ1_9SPHN|nr:prolyl oligopeptidase family serine peptidase [Rhizorhabdus wittichii]QTH20194.1 S9 family peptidase [Rhizorhabdus wittichii]
MKHAAWGMAAALLALASGGHAAPVAGAGDAYARLRLFPDLVRGGAIEPRWLGKGGDFLYVTGEGEHRTLWRFDSRRGSALRLLDKGNICGRLSLAESCDASALLATIAWRQGIATLRSGNASYRIDAEGRITPISAADRTALDRREPRRVKVAYPSTTPDLFEVPAPDGDRLLTLSGGDLAIRDASTDQLSIVARAASPAEEWTLDGARWSPDARWAAILRTDSRELSRLPVVDWLSDVNDVAYQPFPIASGSPLVRSLHLLDTTTGRITQIWVPGDGETIQIAPFTAGGKLRYAILSRDLRRADLFEADPVSGKSRHLLTESDDVFLYWWEDVFQTLRFYTPLADGCFIWASERSGSNQLYLHSADGRLIRQLTFGSSPVVRVIGVDERRGWVIYKVHDDPRRPYDTQLATVGLNGKGARRLTRETGQHHAIVAPDGSLIVDVQGAVDRPVATDVLATDGRRLARLETADASALYALGWQPPEEVLVKADDGVTDIAATVYKPIGFDPSRKYPVVEAIYGGGFKTVAQHGWGPTDSRGAYLQALAQRGFIGVVIDARGTPGRSRAFQEVAARSFGQHEIADHAAALRNLAATRPWMDLERVGIFGISFGGYYTVRALLQRPDLYKVGVALSTAEIGSMTWDIATVPYLGPYKGREKAYLDAGNIPLANRLDGKLLMVIGSDDVNTPISQTLRLADAFIRADKRFDMLVVPGANHALRRRDGSSALPYVYDRITDYMTRNLRP